MDSESGAHVLGLEAFLVSPECYTDPQWTPFCLVPVSYFIYSLCR